ncbi:glycoside hydrolase family 97 catalytic domain-containing protein [Chitinophaga sp. OAE865]|uniref:glycoside hydrolase family 97 protein n=1 Tax=Chitinophaga sp. OAE865 TaxID=2817898 RepID=UPI001AE267EF
MYRKIVSLGLCLFSVIAAAAQENIIEQSRVVLQSPDKNYEVQFYQRQNAEQKRQMYYTVSYKHTPVILESLLGIQLDNHLSENAMALKVDRHASWCENLAVKAISKRTQDTTWAPVYGERTLIRDHFNEAVVHLVKDDNPIYNMDVELRAYNEGIALRYFFPENEKGTYYRVTAEHTNFTLPEGTQAWHASWAQAPYRLLPLSQWPDNSERPLTLQLPGGKFVCLAEAQMTDYSRTKFTLDEHRPNTIVTAMHDPADLVSPVGTPWRVIMAGDRAGDLIENDFLVLNLNQPSRVKETSWIKPGKIIRVMTQTTADAISYIDFAAAHHLQYILFDWKWYGPAFTFTSDVTRVVAPLDMPRIIAYGKEKNVGVWLYVNQQGLLAQSDSLYRVYHDWGVVGVKFGFVQVGSHRWTTWIQEQLQKAAENNIMVNIHDEYRPTGEQRTWPNFLTAEGIRGNEEFPDATHNTVLPFTRMIAGPGDYTICYYDKRLKTTHAHQLALSVVMYSPLQTLFWYDKPALYENEPEIEFFEKVPASWDETKILEGAPGQFITTARRKGAEWFIGAITNNNARTQRLPLSFLSPGKKYLATIYTDDPKAAAKTKVGIRTVKVTDATVMDIRLQASGGQAVWIRPE